MTYYGNKKYAKELIDYYNEINTRRKTENNARRLCVQDRVIQYNLDNPTSCCDTDDVIIYWNTEEKYFDLDTDNWET